MRILVIAVMAVLSGIFGFYVSQAPEFAQQYSQRLGGAISELTIIVRNFEATAARRNKDRSKALALMDRDVTPFVRDLGADMRHNIARLGRFQGQQLTLTTGGTLNRVLTVALQADPDLYRQTRDAYEISFRLDGTLLGALGFVASGGLSLIALFAFAARRPTVPAN